MPHADEEPALYINVLAKYFLPPSAEAGTATRMFFSWLSVDEVNRQIVEERVLEAFHQLDIDGDNNALAPRVIRWVNRRVNQLLALGLSHLTAGESIVVEAEISFCVDQLPPNDVFTVEYSGPIGGGRFDGDGNGDTDTFDVLSEDEIQIMHEELVKEEIEKAVTCSICLIDAPMGSELARLPCSHRYHMDCIGSWLERKNNCPYCRFELRLKRNL